MLCESCLHIVCAALKLYRNSSPLKRASFTTHETSITLKQLQDSYNQSCFLCGIIVDRNEWLLDHPVLQSTSRAIFGKVADITSGDTAFPSYSFYLHLIADRTLGPDILAVGILYFKFHLLDRIPTSLFPIINKATTSTGDKSVLSLARKWLHHCIASHTDCGKDHQKGCPSRLIDLGQACETVTEYCRLVEVSSKPLESYITLSHRWGDSTPTLTAKTYQSLSSGVSWTAMPGIFRDAAIVARFIGARYLWIDSLCIFQDNQRDVNHEVLKMQDIYSNSLCNIAALTAKSESLFVYRNPLRVGQHSVILGADDGLDSPVMINDVDEWKFSIDQSPLMQRGWVLQERLLAQRTLYFGSEQVFWECQKTRCSETYPLLDSNADNTMRSREQEQTLAFEVEHASDLDTMMKSMRHREFLSRRRATPRFSRYLVLSGEERNSSVEQDWFSFVEHYSKLNLTFDKDKLPAISGIAKRYSQTTGFHWAAGHWIEHGPLSLLWHRFASKSTRRVLWLPSWSWASQASEIKYGPPFMGSTTAVAKVQNVKCKTIDDDPFGTVVYGIFRLRVTLIAFVLDATTGKTGFQTQEGVVFPQNIYMDTVGCPIKDTDDRKDCFCFFKPYQDLEDGRLHLLGPKYLAAIISTTRDHDRFDNGPGFEEGRLSSIICGLVIEGIGNLDANNVLPPIYRRVGYFELSYDDPSTNNILDLTPVDMLRYLLDAVSVPGSESADGRTEICLV